MTVSDTGRADAASDPSAKTEATDPQDQSRLILDWDEKADLLAWGMTNDRYRLVDSWFAQHGFNPPSILWNFSPEEVEEVGLTRSFAYWRGLVTARPISDVADLVAGFSQDDGAVSSLLECVDGQRDCRYLRFASMIAQTQGEDWTGRRLSEYAVRSYRGVFYLALYRVMAKRRIPCLVRHETENRQFGAAFCRLMAPLGDASGRVIGFFNANRYLTPA